MQDLITKLNRACFENNLETQLKTLCKIASAILDRLLHHATVINIKGSSYRLKDRYNSTLKTEQGGDNF